MPPICWHLATAQDAAQHLAHACVQERASWFLLGATAPDIRVIGKLTRAETHFYDLDASEQESGAVTLFRRYPDLAGRLLNESQRAFMAGYLTHLTVDEFWIETVYRPLFGSDSPLGDDPHRDLLDRVTQFHMDRGVRLDRDRMADLGGILSGFQAEGDISFLDEASLHQWQGMIANIVGQDPDWELFSRLANRYFPDSNTDEVLRQAPVLLERALDYVSPERLAAFREEAVRRSIAVVEGYLS
ncbi:MAG: zinc dependent phospholipase C family protein [Chloroflexi bacterium]|nr:zinc dependent phospholipase C family protein [Chloroflexota bacterium]